MFQIRSFRNDDAAHLAQVWQEHHRAANLELPLSSTTFEQVVFAKPYFDADGLLVVELENRPIGFIHAAFSGLPDGSDIDPKRALISALCITPINCWQSTLSLESSESKVAELLLGAAERYLLQRGAENVEVFGILPDIPFYLGLAAGDGQMGVTAEDVRLRQWLIETGYTPASAIDFWELDLTRYSQPIDRTQLQIRRMTHVDRILSEAELCWWHSCVLAHTDQLAFQITVRATGSAESQAIFWQHDSGLTGMRSPVVRLWNPCIPTQVEQAERWFYLFGEAIRQLQLERFQSVRVVCDSSNLRFVEQLRRLGFRNKSTGQIFTKALSSSV